MVLAALLASLTITSALLLALAPAPLTPDASRSLVMLDQNGALDLIFDTDTSIRPGRWQYIYIHHSKAPGGNALSIGQRTGGILDHFLIGNGNGSENGEIQVGQRWTLQQPAGILGHKQPLPQLSGAADNYISICLVGDFDQAPPTPRQLTQLQQLVQALQRRLGIPGASVLAFDRPGNSAGIGRQFPAVAFSQHLLP